MLVIHVLLVSFCILLIIHVILHALLDSMVIIMFAVLVTRAVLRVTVLPLVLYRALMDNSNIMEHV